MKNNQKLPAAILFLSLIGMAISIYLTCTHYSHSNSAFCDFSEKVSCSLINKSVYSEIFGIPVAFFGVLWFIALFVLSLKALKRSAKAPSLLLAWSSIGVAFVFYLIYIEFILQTLCLFCTFIHIIVFSVLVMSFIMRRSSLLQKQ